MENYYYDAKKPDSYGSAAGLRRQIKSSNREIQNWLKGENAYTLHRRIVRKFKRRKTFSKGINDLWQIDVLDLSNLSRFNDGRRYLLVCIDVFSKVARVESTARKNADDISNAFTKMIIDQKPVFLQSDRGKEFYNATFQKLLHDNDIKLYSSNNEDIKAAVVERFNRTLMTRLHRYFSSSRTYRYLDVLPDLVKSYNETFHRSIKTAPILVDASNEARIRRILYKPKPKKLRYKFKVGDTVRIVSKKLVFAKGYRPNWTEEVFTVTALYSTDPPTYGLTDLGGEKIEGKFYSQELGGVNKSDCFTVEKVLKKKTIAGKTRYLVKWLGYPGNFNSWVDELHTIKR